MSNTGNINVIFVITFSPKYNFFSTDAQIIESASHHWINPEGQVLGVWEKDWGNQLGFKIKEYYPNVNFEVWRIDSRADKIYEHVFYNGVVNKSFPVKKCIFLSGLKFSKQDYSPAMELLLETYCEKYENIVLLIPASRKAITVKLSNKFRNALPIINTHFLYAKKLLKWQFNFESPLKIINNYVKHIQQTNYTKKNTNLVVAHKEFTNALNNKYGLNVFFNTFGSDLTFWKPVINKTEARKRLNLPSDTKIFLLSSRLVPEYQIDKVLKVVSLLKSYDILFLFTSSGDVDYVNALKKIVLDYKIEDKVYFTGYVDLEKLKLFYAACDYFFMSSITNAGPMSSFFAMLMERPVITTNLGLAAEILDENHCGILLPPKNYHLWHTTLKEVIEGREVKTIEREKVLDIFNWENIVNNWMDIFTKSVNDFHKKS